MTPGQVVEALDRYIVGQDKAKRAVAIALRNRYRREKLGAEMREEIIPKNILMVGPTGVGKTEIARRLAKLVGAPFMKVEATKYTEVGYVGRDVESMIRELAIVGARMVERENMIKVRKEARRAAIERLLDAMQGREEDEERDSGALGSLFGGWGSRKSGKKEKNTHPHEETYERSLLRRELFGGKLDDKIITLNLEDEHSQEIQVMAGGIDEVGVNIQDVFGGILPKKRTKHKLSIRRAFQVLVLEESKKMIDPEEVKRAAVDLVENQGILFLDELDKVAGKEGGHGPDVSREGVQRDILPIVEGCSVNTKIGQVRTDHILFIAAGAFHETKPSDLIPELQGRFPIRVALESLKEEDFKRILTEPENSLTRQYRELLATEGVEVEFSDDGLAELASMACQVNEQTENIGARRLHTMLERVLERISFEAPEMKGQKVVIDREYVLNELKDICASRDLSRFIL
ncbi:MAG: ATP-dependent protease ATPase subunit HslU [bacterium]|nr:ATP-dependent protease ATPase subunit HslU [bacterium]